MTIRYTIRIFLALVLAGLFYFVGKGCSPTMYFANTNNQKDNYCELYPDRAVCQTFFNNDEDDEDYEEDEGEPPRTDTTSFVYRLSLGKVDMIFVIDNSSSMAKEHKSLARQFRSFLSEIKDVDYHIAVITTDISSSPNNPVRDAPYQDGKFIPIGGQWFLRNENLGYEPSEQTVEDFQTAIVREETLSCDSTNQRRASSSRGNEYDEFYQKTSFDDDSYKLPKCPNADERGTYALNLAIKNPQHQSFFRPEVHTMFVILSDEDVRSGREYIEQFQNERYSDRNYELEYLDEPVVLVESLVQFFPGKTFSFFPIIIPPGDRGCLNEQNRNRGKGQGTGRGYYGREYHSLARVSDEYLSGGGQVLRGETISICDRNYGAQLSRVALYAETIKVPLPCENPEHTFVYVNNRKTRAEGQVNNEDKTYTTELSEIPLNALLEVEFVCDSRKVFSSARDDY